MVLSLMFISSYTTIYSFVKKGFFFERLYFSKYDIRMQVSNFKVNIYSLCFLLKLWS